MKKLNNYLRAHRKSTGLSQREVAYLLGMKSGSQVSRHELFIRSPELETALAYQALYESPVSELFAGLYEKVEQRTLQRAWLLAVKLNRTPPSRAREWKLAWIRANCGPRRRSMRSKP